MVDLQQACLWAVQFERACFPDPWDETALYALAQPPVGQLCFWCSATETQTEAEGAQLFCCSSDLKGPSLIEVDISALSSDSPATASQLPTSCRGYALYWTVLDEVQLHRFAIHPRIQGRGEGRAFMRTLLQFWQERGAKTVTLEVRESNRAARALYEFCGFLLVGARPGYYSDTGEAACLYTATIGGDTESVL